MTHQQESEQQALLTLAHNHYYKDMHTHSYFKVHNSMLSEDLVQDTFIKTWQYIAKGGKIEMMKSFLYHVLNNLIIDEYRKKKPMSLDVLLENGFEPVSADAQSFVDRLDGKTAQALILRLPVKYQEIMIMRYVDDLSLEEMASITGQSRNTLAVQIHRGVEKLRVIYNRK